jgi:hypothetical protein
VTKDIVKISVAMTWLEPRPEPVIRLEQEHMTVLLDGHHYKALATIAGALQWTKEV